MFVDLRDQFPPPRWEPPRPPQRQRLTKRQERVFGWIIAINLFLVLVSPIGGATMVTALVALFRH